MNEGIARTAMDMSGRESLAFSPQQLRSFRLAVDQAIRETRSTAGTKDLNHCRLYTALSRLVVVLGLSLAAWQLNPLSPLLVVLGWMGRWGIAHQILHRSYSGIPGCPKWMTGSGYARGWRRAWDWCEWITPDAWQAEHDIHHVHTGGVEDPDVVEANVEFLRQAEIPRWRKVLTAMLIVCTWRLSYYAPSTFIQLRRKEQGLRPTVYTITGIFMFASTFNPLSREGRAFWRRCLLPCAAMRFIALPISFLPFGWTAVLNVLVTIALAEVLFNAYSWAIIASNHTAVDLYRFSGKAKDKDHWYLQQVLATVNYDRSPGVRDWSTGWINYHIEHHLCPNLTLRQLELVSGCIERICNDFGIPYRSDSLVDRSRLMFEILTGVKSMPRIEIGLVASREYPLRGGDFGAACDG
jgi:fatty acid desaturase